MTRPEIKLDEIEKRIKSFYGDIELTRYPVGEYGKAELEEFISDFVLNEFNTSDIFGYDRVCRFKFYIRLFQIAFSEENGKAMISYFPDMDKVKVDRRFKMKPGKFLRKLFPESNDSIVERFVDKYRTAFDPAEYTFHESTDAKDFGRVYQMPQAPMQNPATTYYRKSLSNSCMRYDFSNLPEHPCNAYGSGDFKIVWITDSNGHLAGRCVVNIAKHGIKLETPTMGPIYGISETAMNLIESKLKAQGAKMGDSDSWIDARVRNIPYGSEWIAPYLDFTPQAYNEIGDYLVIASGGSITGNQYQGTQQNEDSCQCHDCNDSIHGDDAYSNDYGEQFCESCYFDRYGICDSCHETESNDSLTGVYVETRHGRELQRMCECCRDENAVYLESESEYWHLDDVIFCEYDGNYIRHDDPDYFQCENSMDVFPISERVETEDGESWAEESAIDYGYEYHAASGLWVTPYEGDYPLSPTPYGDVPRPVTSYDSHVTLWRLCHAFTPSYPLCERFNVLGASDTELRYLSRELDAFGYSLDWKAPIARIEYELSQQFTLTGYVRPHLLERIHVFRDFESRVMNYRRLVNNGLLAQMPETFESTYANITR